MKNSQKRGLNKIGDVIIPGDTEMPAFSKTGCFKNFERIGDYMPEDDRKNLLLLLTLFGFFPRWLLRIKWYFIELSRYYPGPLGTVGRQVRIGIKGLVFSLYYADAPQAVGYEVSLNNFESHSENSNDHLTK